MPSHDICQNAKVSIGQVRALKQTFEDSFSRALSSGHTKDIQQAQKNKRAFLNKMAEVRMKMHALAKRFVQTHEKVLFASLSHKRDTGEPLTKYELFGLYEMYTSTLPETQLIEWRTARDHQADLAVMFDEFSNEIARSMDEITPETRIYIGKVNEPDFFQRIPNTLKLIYTNFPEKRIRRHDIEIGGKSIYEFRVLLDRISHGRDRYFSNMEQIMDQPEFQRSFRVPDPTQPDWKKWELKSKERITLIQLHVSDLGFLNRASIGEINAQAKKLGLELCSSDVVFSFRLKYKNQPVDERVQIGVFNSGDMSSGSIDVFDLTCHDNQRFLDHNLHTIWDTGSNAHYLFRLRKPAHQSESESEKPTT